MKPELKTKPFALLTHYLRPYRGRVVLLALLLLGSIGLQLLAPQVIRRFLDAAVADRQAATLATLSALFFLVVLSQKALATISIYFTEDLGWATTNALRGDLAAHVLRLDMGFHKLRTPGELIERIDTEVGNMAEYFSELVSAVLANSILVIGVIVLLFLEAWPAGVIALAYAVVILGFLRAIQNRVVHLYTAISQATAELFGFLEERLTGTEDMRGNGGEAYVMARLYPLVQTYADLRTRTYTFGAFTGSFSVFLFAVAQAATLGYGAYAYRQGQMTIGAVFLLFSYIALMSEPINEVRRNIGDMQRALANIRRVGEFFAVPPESGRTGTVSLPGGAPAVTFAGVSFAYKDRPPAEAPAGDAADAEAATQPVVLQDISLTIPAGQVLGILGRTGSGKTTLSRLLFRLYDPDAGAITLDGVDLRDLALSDLRGHIGLVTQDVQLFAATVRDNLTLFRHLDPDAPPISDAQIMTALETLGLGDWLRGLPDGLDTRLGADGQGLSAGQAQLLALTRVFLRDPQVVVLDEASSRLDPATEHLLEQAIDRLLDGRTGLVIAHRLRTVGRADAVVILERGQVLEHGPRAALAADPDSHFHRLLQTGLEEVLV
jgi:ABC-type multidrug transport system fused ATPase/permease subunit